MARLVHISSHGTVSTGPNNAFTNATWGIDFLHYPNIDFVVAAVSILGLDPLGVCKVVTRNNSFVVRKPLPLTPNVIAQGRYEEADAERLECFVGYIHLSF
jgi:hypothetical protein